MNSELNIDFNRRLEEKRTRKEEKRAEDVAVTVPIPAEMPEPAVPMDARMHVEEVGCAMLTAVKDDLPPCIQVEAEAEAENQQEFPQTEAP